MQPIARLEAAEGGLARAELEHRTGSAHRGEASGLEVRRNPEHAELGVEEHDVDREAHEPRVDRRGRTEQQPLTGTEAPPPEESLHAAEPRLGQQCRQTGSPARVSVATIRRRPRTAR